MRRLALILVIPLLLGLVAACTMSSSTSPVEGTLTIPNGLGFGGDNDGIIVQFLRVTNDSRCAAGVQCIRAGEAQVTLGISVDGGRQQESTIEMIPGGSAKFEVNRFTVTLLELRPDPPPVGGVEQDQYELDVRIEET